MELYYQCDIIKEGLKDTIWIPAKWAIEKLLIKVKYDDEWDDKWQIVKVYRNACRTDVEVNERSQDYKRTRKASDI